jgi:diguanylate cyclase
MHRRKDFRRDGAAGDMGLALDGHSPLGAILGAMSAWNATVQIGFEGCGVRPARLRGGVQNGPFIAHLPKAHIVCVHVGGHEQAMFRNDARTGLNTRAPAAPPADDDRSMVLAHRAMALIKALKLPATPRIYEFCYAYATGDYPSLNLVINDLLNRRIAVGDDTIKQIGAKYIPRNDNGERIDNVGLRVKHVINDVLGALGTIIGAEDTFSNDLAQTGDKLATVKNRQALVDEIKIMMQSAGRVGDEQRRLEERLNTSIDEINDLRGQLQKIRSASVTDPITGLPNRHAFEQSLEKAMADRKERKASVCLVLCDIDDFKKFNDAWGHPTGDQVLCLVAMEVRQKVGKSGIVARLSSAQFAVILPNAQIDAARALADQIRCAIMSRDITMRSTSQKLGRVSLSFGIVTAQADEDAESLVFRVQTCLRAAKDRGKNRVVCENDPDTTAPELRVGFG